MSGRRCINCFFLGPHLFHDAIELFLRQIHQVNDVPVTLYRVDKGFVVNASARQRGHLVLFHTTNPN